MTGQTEKPYDPVREAANARTSLYEAAMGSGYQSVLRIRGPPGFEVALDLKQLIAESPPNGYLNTTLKSIIFQHEETYDAKLARLEAKVQAKYDELLSKTEAQNHLLSKVRVENITTISTIRAQCEEMLVKLDAWAHDSNDQQGPATSPSIEAESPLSTATTALPRGRGSRDGSHFDDDADNRRSPPIHSTTYPGILIVSEDARLAIVTLEDLTETETIPRTTGVMNLPPLRSILHLCITQFLCSIQCLAMPRSPTGNFPLHSLPTIRTPGTVWTLSESQYLAATVMIGLVSTNSSFRWDGTDETNVLVAGD